MRFATGALVTLVAKGFALVIGVATSVLTARALGPEGRGILALLIFYQGLTVTFGMLGMNGSITYFLSRDPGRSRDIIQNAVMAAVVGGVAVAVLLWGLAWTAPRLILGNVPMRYLEIFLISVPFTFLAQFLQTVFLAKQRFVDFNVLDLIVRAVQLAGFAVVLVVLGGGTPEAVSVLAGAAVVGGLVVTAWTRVVEPFRLGFDRALFGEMFSYGTKVFASSVLMFLAFRVHLMVINLQLGEGAAGVYSVALQLVDVLYLLPVTLSMILFPKVSSGEDPGALLMLRVFRTTLFVMAALCTLVAVFGREIILLLFGQPFVEASHVLVWLAPGIVALSLVNVVNNDLAGRGQLRYAVLAPMVSLIVMLPPLAWTLPRYGIVAAGMVASAGYVLMAGILVWHLRRTRGVAWADLFVPRRSDLFIAGGLRALIGSKGASHGGG